MIARLAAGITAGLVATAPAQAELTYQVSDFQSLSGWAQDDHAQALTVFLNTCMDMDQPDYAALCDVAAKIGNPRAFFELFFRPVLIEHSEQTPLFTGYFEPELNGSLAPSARYRYPVYRKPPEAKGQWLTREQIETSDVMTGRGLEIAWVDDPVELFFLQIQGSGRIKLPSGNTIRVGYGGNNGHNYRSVGAELVRRGIYQSHQVSAQVIQNWVKRNPVDGPALLRHNPTYVFFRNIGRVSADKGPLGAMNRSITAGRSIAIDPKYTPLGAPVWVDKAGADPLKRLMIAQDTGSAIKGAQRADIFVGTGDAAGKVAGKLKDPGRMYVLMPIQRAYAQVAEEFQ